MIPTNRTVPSTWSSMATGSRMSLLMVMGAMAFSLPRSAPAELKQWYKGNTHTHTWWSDGDSPPETVVQWYKEHGYQFLALSDHNILSEGEKWITPDGPRGKAAEHYERQFGPGWIEKREHQGKTEYRLKPLNELRALYEEAGKFLLIQAEEISDSFEGKPIHVNGINLRDVIPPPGGRTLIETIQNNIDAVLDQRRRTGQPMFPHVNHPNFGWAITPEDLVPLRGEQFFEVYNGHPSVHTYGDEQHPSTERMWDIILTRRLGDLNLPVMYGVATDDAHTYTAWGHGKANPGRGWVVVRAGYLTPASIVLAMERGDFYASTGVVLKEVRFTDNTLEIEIEAQPGVQYTTQFIGTLNGYERIVPDRTANPASVLAPRYSPDIGRVLDEQAGPRAVFRLSGREIYVRAKVLSSQKHPNPYAENDVEVAWVQPVQPRQAATSQSAE